VVLFAVTWTATSPGATREATAGLSAADRLVFSVFYCEDACDHPVHTANSDGSELRTITLGRFPKNRDNPAWSLDRKTTAYDSLEGIYIKGARGGGERRLLGTDQGDRPRWSPDGIRIVYTEGPDGIAIVNTAGGHDEEIVAVYARSARRGSLLTESSRARVRGQ
jgi:WD40-like Beta Propeller Repeat